MHPFIQHKYKSIKWCPKEKHLLSICYGVNMKTEQNRVSSRFQPKIPDIFSINNRVPRHFLHITTGYPGIFSVFFPASFIGKVYNFPDGHSKIDT